MARYNSARIQVIPNNILPQEWSTARVQDLLEEGSLLLVQDGNHGGDYPQQEDFVTEGIPLIRGNNLVNGTVSFEGCQYITETKAENLRIGFAKPDDVLLTHKGTMGKTAIVPKFDKWEYIILNPQITLYRVSDQGRLDRKFLKYFFDSPDFQKFLENVSGMSTISTLSLVYQKSLELPFPPLSEQHAIAGILGALDDKIELNRRMNATLESMSRAVFRQWFVDNEQATDWKNKKMGEVCEFAYGKGLKEDKRQAGAIPVYGSNGQIGWHNECLVKGPGIVIGRKGNPGIVTWTQNDFFPIDTTFYVALKDSETSLYWLYYTLTSLNLPDLGADSAVPGLNRNIAYTSDVNYPPNDLMRRYDDFAKPLFDKIDANEKESRMLASLRDVLLPKLMRGEVRVKDVEGIT